MPPALPSNPLLLTRQSSGDSSSEPTCSCPNSLSGGAIAGIVIGTIAGTLLIMWLLYLCRLPGAWGETDPDQITITQSPSGRRSRSRRYSSSVGYAEKPAGRRYRDVDVEGVRRPRKVYLS